MNSSLNIVIPSDDPQMIAGSPHLERLRDVGNVTLYDTRPADEEEQIARVQNADVIINSRSQVKWNAATLHRLPRLKLISLCSIGTDCVDLTTAAECDVAVCNVPGQTAGVVAEHAFALMFGVARQLAWLTADMKRGNWSNLLLQSVTNRTLGVIGTGNIGREMIRLARGIGMKVIAWSFHPDHEIAKELGFHYVPFDQLLTESDVLSLHVKLTRDSQRLIGANEFASMKPNSILINTSRGAVVDTAALVHALNSGALYGAGLDVFENEPLAANDPLLSCEHVVLTPHAADQLPEGIDALNAGAVENVLAMINGNPQNVVTG